MTKGTVFTWPLRHTRVVVTPSFITSLLVSPLPDPPCKPTPFARRNRMRLATRKVYYHDVDKQLLHRSSME